ncbi:MAG TPA: hypothetical protein VIY90_18730 [Steroidobacteraceae bacterium]
MLAVVLVGFSRTLFLRPLFQVPAIPWYAYAHGSVMTMWFMLLVVQSSLVAAQRTDAHRRLGILGAALAVVVVILGLLITLKIPGHFKIVGYTSTGGPPHLTSLPTAIRALWGDIGTLTFFLVLVATGVCMRRRPEVHKRLMLLASMTMIAPALGRVTEFPDLSGITVAAPTVTVLLRIVPIGIALGLPLTLAAYDLRGSRRVHPATAWGLLGFVGVAVATRVVIPATAVGEALWKALG